MTANLQRVLESALGATGIPAVPVVVPTRWDVGEVTAYLFPDEPVTLIDCGVPTAEGRRALNEALAGAGREPSDVRRVIVTHGHTDHFGGAVWLQQESGCEVLLHAADMELIQDVDHRAMAWELFGPLGFTPTELETFLGAEAHEWKTPSFSPLGDGAVFGVGAHRLRIEHHPGHTPGHLWVVEESSGAIFVGDYLIADHPTNAGIELARRHPTGRVPLLQQYNAGLRELADRPAPVLFPGHGPPITDHAAVIARRLHKSSRRTERVLTALRSGPPTSALDLGRRMYRDRMSSWEVVSDLVGRLDLLVAERRARADLGEDGVWYFAAEPS